MWAALFFPALLAAQQLPPSATLRKSVNLIQVPVVVRDSKGRAVPNLKAGDFAVYDNGKLQTINQFRYLQRTQDSNKPEANSAPSEVISSAGSSIDQSPLISTAGSEGWQPPHLLIVIPQLQLTSRVYALRSLAKALQHHLFDNESVSIVDNSSLILPFTRDTGSLEQAITKLQKLNMSPCHAGPWIAAAEERLLQMRSMPGRKFLLIFSDDRPDPQCVTTVTYVGSSPWRLLASALDSNVAIYPVDPRGVVPVIPGGDASTDLAGGGGPRELANTINENLWQELTLLGMQRSSLLQVAAQTGGRSPAGNDLEHAFRDMQEDSSYYDLAYCLSDLEADGAYHRIHVALRRRDLQVLTKSGYFAPIPLASLSRASKRDWLYRALLADQPLGEIEVMSRSSAFFTPPSADTMIRLAVQARWWIPHEYASDRRWTMLLGVVQDEHGNVIDHFDTQNFWHATGNPTAEGGYVRQDATYNVLLRLKPGRYELKLAVADLYSALAGSFHTFFQISEQPPKLPTASPVVLANGWVTLERTTQNSDIGENPTAEVNRLGEQRNADPLMLGERRLEPSVDHIYTNNGQLSVFARFYQALGDHFPNGWKVSAILRDSNGKIVADEAATVTAQTSSDASGIPVFHNFDLSKLPLREGRYSAELEFAHPDRKSPLRLGSPFIVQTTPAP